MSSYVMVTLIGMGKEITLRPVYQEIPSKITPVIKLKTMMLMDNLFQGEQTLFSDIFA